MNMPEWLKSSARKKREEAAFAEEFTKRQAEIAREKEQQRQYEARVIAASAPDKLAESGVATLVDLIKNYKDVRIKGDKWWFGNIVFDTDGYDVSYYEGFSYTTLFEIPELQYRVVDESIKARLEKMRPVKTDLERVSADMEHRKKGLTDKEAIGKLYDEYRLYRRDVFVRLARETLAKNK